MALLEKPVEERLDSIMNYRKVLRLLEEEKTLLLEEEKDEEEKDDKEGGATAGGAVADKAEKEGD